VAQSFYLSVDIGTGSVRAALVDRSGAIRHIAALEHDQITPRYGWSEQRADDWWAGAVHVIRLMVAEASALGGRIEALAACGQMHGTVLVGQDNLPVRETVPLWNDKRTLSYVQAWEATHSLDETLRLTANPATPAWPGFKLQWLRDNDPAAWASTTCVMMPKDYINLRLTGQRAMDWTDVACSFLMDPATGTWSGRMLDLLGLEAAKLPPVRLPKDILGTITVGAAAQTGLPIGLPVLVGGGDYPMALLGSGVSRPGMASEVAGTSSIISVMADHPILNPEICNTGTPEGHWAAFVLLESGGDSARWARRSIAGATEDYAQILTRAANAPPGSEGLFFLPYLMGERLGAHRNSRAQFFGLTARHGAAHLHRAVLEGVAFAVDRHLSVMTDATGQRPDQLVLSGGGAKADLWVQIKASVYDMPILIPSEPECGAVGCAILASAATGQFASVDEAVAAFVRYDREVLPDRKAAETYARMKPLFNRLYANAQHFYDDLDALALGQGGSHVS
jgi:xylulokinase